MLEELNVPKVHRTFKETRRDVWGRSRVNSRLSDVTSLVISLALLVLYLREFLFPSSQLTWYILRDTYQGCQRPS